MYNWAVSWETSNTRDGLGAALAVFGKLSQAYQRFWRDCADALKKRCIPQITL